LSVLALIAGCGEVSVCQGARPDLSECKVGYFFADCGGGAEPALACREGPAPLGPDCLWFSGGCVAQGFVASNCDSESVCCHDGWPFADDEFDKRLRLDLHGLGTQPWDESTAAVMAVSVDAALTAEEIELACEGSPPACGEPCGRPELSAEFTQLQDTLFVRLSYRDIPCGKDGQSAAWFPVIEIIPDVDGAMRARLCSYAPNVFTGGCDGTTRNASHAPTCATTGSVRINRWPANADETAGVVLEFDAVFASGYHLQGTLVPDGT
jgi:hypothetical protein